MDLRKICEQVCEVVLAAGDFIGEKRLTFSTDKVELKGRHDLVTDVDREVEKLIVQGLKKTLPEASILAEEGTAIDGNEYKWVIDPLDGTINFTHGMPPFCVSVALVKGREVVLGVVYEITGDECFYAWKDSPAYLNGKEITVSTEPEVENSLVMTGMAYSPEYDRSELNRLFDYFNVNSHGVRRTGSAAANLVYVASGRGDCFFQTGLSPWDVAAGALIVERAGGRVTDYSKGDNYVYGREIIASNGVAHDKFFEIIVK